MKRLGVWLLALGVAFLPAALPAAGQEDVVAEIRRLEMELSYALVARNLETVRRIWAEDYTYTDGEGRVDTREGFLRAYTAGTITMSALRFDDVVVTPYGDCAVVRGVATAERVVDGVTVSRASRYTRFYIRFPQGWRAVAGHATAVRKPD